MRERPASVTGQNGLKRLVIYPILVKSAIGETEGRELMVRCGVIADEITYYESSANPLHIHSEDFFRAWHTTDLYHDQTHRIRCRITEGKPT